MAYAQKDYLEIQGRNGKYRIDQIGCYLTAFCNLLQRFGDNKSPLELNKIFVDRNIYIDLGDGAYDELGGTSITKYDPSIVVVASGAGRPSSNDSIVKFNFKSGNGQFNTHFSLVQDASKGLIIDSYDGKIKSWDVYGGPVSYNSYRDNTPQSAPQPVKALNGGGDYSVVKQIPGYMNAADAAARRNSNSTVPVGNYAVFNRAKDMVNVTRKAGVPGWWINPGDNTQPAPQPAPQSVEFITVERGWGLSSVAKAAGFSDFNLPDRWANIASLNGSGNWGEFNKHLVPGQRVRVRPAPVAPTPAPTPEPVANVEQIQSAPSTPAPANVEQPDGSTKIEVKTTPAAPVAAIRPPAEEYKESFAANPGTYIAKESVVVHDLDNLHPDLQLIAGKQVNAAGTFIKDNEVYVIARKHLSEGKWYGVPLGILRGTDDERYVGPLKPLTGDEDDIDQILSPDMVKEAREYFGNLTTREKFVAFLAKAQGGLLRLISIFDITKLFKKG